MNNNFPNLRTPKSNESQILSINFPMQALDVAGSEMSLFEHRLLVLRQDLQSSAQQVCYIFIFA